MLSRNDNNKDYDLNVIKDNWNFQEVQLDKKLAPGTRVTVRMAPDNG